MTSETETILREALALRDEAQWQGAVVGPSRCNGRRPSRPAERASERIPTLGARGSGLRQGVHRRERCCAGLSEPTLRIEPPVLPDRAAEVAAVGVPAPGGPVSEKQGWTAASWLVAHADRFGITTVTFAGQRWTAAGGDWIAAAPVRSVVAFETPS